jgi:hypothetical protein
MIASANSGSPITALKKSGRRRRKTISVRQLTRVLGERAGTGFLPHGFNLGSGAMTTQGQKLARVPASHAAARRLGEKN